ncbi:LptE family protein [candidate division KSB1 bacterium]|nr:LptE family protein [candidate division KSB1 bacterium]
MRTCKNQKNVCVFGTLCAICLLFLECGFYSFSGSLPSHLKTVAVPLFDNRTAEFGISEELTDMVIEEFNRDGSLKIADRSGADVVLEGSIIRIDDRAGAFTRQEEVQDLKIYLTVKVKCTDQVKRQTMWDERLTQFGTYDPSAGADGRLDAVSEAIEKISEEILNKTVSGW